MARNSNLRLDRSEDTSLYYPTEDVLAFLGKISVSNQYQVSTRWTGDLATYLQKNLRGAGLSDYFIFGFYATEAVLPGSNLNTTEVYGSYQGITNTFATSRLYPEVEITFYVDADHNTLALLNGWLEYINPTKSVAEEQRFKKLRYPKGTSGYKNDIIIQKFNRDFARTNPKDAFTRATGRFRPANPPQFSYTLKNAFPTRLVSAPISYGEANLVKATVAFNYEQYLISKKDYVDDTILGDEIKLPSGWR